MPCSDFAVINDVRIIIPNKITLEKKSFSLLLYIRAIIRHFLLAAFPCGADAVAFFAENRYVVIFFLC